MNRRWVQARSCTIAAGLLACAACFGGATRESALQSLVSAEHAFSQAAAEMGTRDAFLAYTADDATIFRPRAVNAQQYLRAHNATPGLLSWEPVYADVSEAGDLGFTTGPWEYRTDPDSAAIAHGQYFTFWKKQPDDSWKVVLDHGTSNPPPASGPEPLTAPKDPRYDDAWSVPVWGRDEAIARLLEIDAAFSAASATNGPTAALAGYVTANVRTLRDGVEPTFGAEDLRSHTTSRPGTLTWEPQGGDVSASGDLGYTYGEYEYSPADEGSPVETGVYVRAWRRTSTESWRVVVDVMTPYPPAAI